MQDGGAVVVGMRSEHRGPRGGVVWWIWHRVFDSFVVSAQQPAQTFRPYFRRYKNTPFVRKRKMRFRTINNTNNQTVLTFTVILVAKDGVVGRC